MSIINSKSRREQEEKLKQIDDEAQAFHEEGKYMEELQSLETALMIRRNLHGPDSEQVIRNSVKLCKLCNLLSMAFMEKENFEMALDLLRKAEALSESNLQGKAVTYNNLAC
jgi:tetratricopeptide (TPR) repeat protein